LGFKIGFHALRNEKHFALATSGNEGDKISNWLAKGPNGRRNYFKDLVAKYSPEYAAASEAEKRWRKERWEEYNLRQVAKVRQVPGSKSSIDSHSQDIVDKVDDNTVASAAPDAAKQVVKGCSRRSSPIKPQKLPRSQS
jgi:hypothetical protein